MESGIRVSEVGEMVTRRARWAGVARSVRKAVWRSGDAERRLLAGWVGWIGLESGCRGVRMCEPCDLS